MAQVDCDGCFESISHGKDVWQLPTHPVAPLPPSMGGYLEPRPDWYNDRFYDAVQANGV